MKSILMILIMSLSIATLALSESDPADPTDPAERQITGTVLKVKTSFPYPFERKPGHIWECKVRILYYEWTEPEIYKAYPIRGSGYEWACQLQPGQVVTAIVLYKKSYYRGEIKWIQIVN